MPLQLLQGPTGQKVYVDPTNPDYQGYVSGGFRPFTQPASVSPVRELGQEPLRPRESVTPSSDFTSTDPAIRQRIEEMNRQVFSQSTRPQDFQPLAPIRPPPSPAPVSSFQPFHFKNRYFDVDATAQTVQDSWDRISKQGLGTQKDFQLVEEARKKGWKSIEEQQTFTRPPVVPSVTQLRPPQDFLRETATPQISAREAQIDELLKELKLGREHERARTEGLENEIIAGQKPSAEELAAIQRLRDIESQQASLAAGRELGIANIREQPVAQTFLSGQEAALQRQALARLGGLEAQTTPVKTRLAAIQAQRAAALETAKTRYEFGKEKRQQEKEAVATALNLLKNQRDEARSDLVAQNVVRDDARATLQFAITNNPNAIRQMTTEQRREWEKVAGYQEGFLESLTKTKTIKEQEMEKGRYKTIPATKYHGTLTLDTITGLYRDVAGKTYKTEPTGVSQEGIPRGWDSVVKDARARLQRGEEWGTVWNGVKSRFPKITNEKIDAALGTQFRESGAFEEFKMKQKQASAKTGASDLRDAIISLRSKQKTKK